MLTVEQQSRFWRRGYLPIGQVTTPAAIAQLNAAFDRLTDPGNPGRAPEDHLIRSVTDRTYVRVGLHLCHIDADFREFALNGAIAAIMEALLGLDATVLTSLLFDKQARHGEALTPHQDLPYYPYLNDDELITCWTALDPVQADSGPIEYFPGTHGARLPHRETGSQQALDIDSDTVDLSSSETVTLRAGEAVVHHGLTVHASGPNTSAHRRRGIATLFLPAKAKVSTHDFPYPPLVPPSASPR